MITATGGLTAWACGALGEGCFVATPKTTPHGPRCQCDDCTTIDDTPTPLPTHAIMPGRGKVRVLSYDGNGMFTVLTNRDVRVFVHRKVLTFLPDKPKKKK